MVIHDDCTVVLEGYSFIFRCISNNPPTDLESWEHEGVCSTRVKTSIYFLWNRCYIFRNYTKYSWFPTFCSYSTWKCLKRTTKWAKGVAEMPHSKFFMFCRTEDFTALWVDLTSASVIFRKKLYLGDGCWRPNNWHANNFHVCGFREFPVCVLNMSQTSRNMSFVVWCIPL